MGLPAVITTDQGKEFRNKLNLQLTEKFGIKHQLTTAYHPQANSLEERYNQTLVNLLPNLLKTSVKHGMRMLVK